MGNNMKKAISILMILTLMMGLLSGCGNTKTNESDSVGTGDYSEFLTVDVFAAEANYQGMQSGWFAKVVKDKFNMELNIIAPNVAGGGETLFSTRSAAGNLGDIVMISSKNGKLEDTVTAGLLLDMAAYKDIMPNAMQYTQAIEKIQFNVASGDAIYALPASVSSYAPTEPSETTEPTFGPYVRWDLFEAAGAPELDTLEDLLPVLQVMQDNAPATETGKKVYAFSFFKDWDDSMMNIAKQPTCFYGYDEIGFLLNKADGSETVSILEEGSPYIRSLKFLFEANQMGLVDPESTTQNWDTVWNKFTDGAVLFSPWPWLGQTAYNTVEHIGEGKGFMMAPVKDLNIYSYGAKPAGSEYVVGIGTKAKDPARMAAFIDWLYSPEGIMMSTSQTGSTCGPEGLTWEMVDGKPVLTEFGIQAMLQGGADMPEEWGGGSWKDGTSQINFQAVLPKDINPETGAPYDFKMWDSYLEFTSSPLHQSWAEKTGTLSTMEYLQDNNALLVTPGTNFIAPAEPAEIGTLRSQIKTIVVENSWKMVFASNEEEFNTLLDNMRTTVNELGFEQVLDFDRQSAKAYNEAGDAAVNQ